MEDVMKSYTETHWTQPMNKERKKEKKTALAKNTKWRGK